MRDGGITRKRLGLKRSTTEKLKGGGRPVRPVLFLSDEEKWFIDKIASCWIRTRGGDKQTGMAILMLLRMGIHHIETCVVKEPMNPNITEWDLKEHGYKFLKFRQFVPKSLRHPKRNGRSRRTAEEGTVSHIRGVHTPTQADG